MGAIFRVVDVEELDPSTPVPGGAQRHPEEQAIDVAVALEDVRSRVLPRTAASR